MRSPSRAASSRAALLCLLAVGVATACSLPALVTGERPPAALTQIPAPAAIPSPVPTQAVGAAPNRTTIKWLLYDAATRHGVNPGLVMAVAWWESGWNQAQVSGAGAVGIMQVEPETAATAAPLLLHRSADVHDLRDNIELGTAILREDLDRYPGDLAKGLEAYYAGPPAVREWKDLDGQARSYVLGVYGLAVQFDEGHGPA